MRRLNMARIIMLYVKKFEVTDPTEALQYFYFLRHLKDTEGRNLFLACVSDMVIECRDYELFFGKTQSNGVRSRGLIDQFESIEIDAFSAANLVAEELVKKGMFEDAIKLFDLAGNHEEAIRYTSILLSQVVHQESKPGTLRERLQIKAHELATRYGSMELSCNAQITATFNLLRELSIFFDHYHENNHQYALEILERIKLIPLNMSQLENCVANFKKFGGEISKVFPDVLLAAMDILFKKYKALRAKETTSFDDTGRDRVSLL